MWQSKWFRISLVLFGAIGIIIFLLDIEEQKIQTEFLRDIIGLSLVLGITCVFLCISYLLNEIWKFITTIKEIGYHPNGKLMFSGKKRLGVRQGLFDFYNEDGKLDRQINYFDGVVSQENLIHSKTGKSWKSIHYRCSDSTIDRVWIKAENASDEEKDDIDFMREAILNTYFNLQFASLRLRSNKDFIEWCIGRYRGGLEFAAPSLKSDRVYVLELIKTFNNDEILAHISDNLKNDPDFVRILIKKFNPLSFKYASNELKSNKEFILDALKRGCDTGYIEHMLIYISTDLYEDGDFMLTIYEISKDDFICSYMSKRLLRDRKFILSALEVSHVIFNYISKKLKKDKEILQKIINKHGLLNYASEKQQNDREIVLGAVKQWGHALKFASTALKNDREIVLAAVEKSGTSLQFASNKLQNERDIVLAAVKVNGSALEFASDELKNDIDIVMIAIRENSHSFKYASKELQNDRVTVLAAVQQRGSLLQYTSKELQNDREVVLVAVKNDWSALKHASNDLKNDREVVLVAVKTNRFALEYASDELRDAYPWE